MPNHDIHYFRRENFRRFPRPCRLIEDSPISLSKWSMTVWLIVNCKNGVSSYELHRGIGVTQKTGWFMLHRVRAAIKANGRALRSFYEVVQREWHRWLNRRSQQHCMTWERFDQLLQHYRLPQPVVVHSVHRAQRTRDPRSRMR